MLIILLIFLSYKSLKIVKKWLKLPNFFADDDSAVVSSDLTAAAKNVELPSKQYLKILLIINKNLNNNYRSIQPLLFAQFQLTLILEILYKI